MLALRSKEWFVGVCLALILQTNYRLMTGVGIGELGLAAIVALGPLFTRRVNDDRSFASERFAGRFLVYLLACLLPSTILTHLGFWGSLIDPAVAWKDYCAYLLNGLFIWTLAYQRFDIRSCSVAFVLSSLALMALQYLYGGAEAWYSARFTAGAHNPNQLALYCMAAIVIAATAFSNVRSAAPAIVLFLFFGWESRSDALVVSMLAGFVVLLMAVAFPPRYVGIGITAVTVGMIYLAFFSMHQVTETLGARWGEADEGGGRLTLLVNGAKAWLNSEWSVLFGNGAGAFSGKGEPFEGDESHNTIVDSLAIGGVMGVALLFDPPFRALWAAYSARRPLVFASMAGLLAFSCFHYVGRHPVFWFAVLASGEACRKGACALQVNGVTRRPLPSVPSAKAGARLGAC
jgi:hypothetical protein